MPAFRLDGLLVSALSGFTAAVHGIFAACQSFGEKAARVRAWVPGNVLGSAGDDDPASAITAFGPQVHDPIGCLDDVQIVLDNHHRVAVVAQPVQHAQKLLDVVESAGR